MDFEKLKTEFDALGVKEQWQWILDHKSDISIALDNDNTSVLMDGDKGCDHVLYPKTSLGNRIAVSYLLEILGFAVEQ